MMAYVHVRLHGDLLFFVAAGQAARSLTVLLPDMRAAVKNPIEALGVPHTEISALTVNGAPVDFSRQVGPDDRVDVYGFDAENLPRQRLPLRPALPHPVRFVADTHLGRLAHHLRLFGFDTLYRADYEDEELAHISATEGRVLLSRDRGLLKRKIVDFGYCPRTGDPRRQLVAVLRRYALAKGVRPWQRCARCNGLLQPVDKVQVLAELQPKTRQYFDDFRRCQQCGQIYWQGSHYARIECFMAQVLAEASQ